MDLKKAHTAPPMESLLQHHTYAFNINFKEQQDLYSDTSHSFIVKDRASRHSMYAKQVLQDLKGTAYCLNLEISPTGRLHWHGYLQIFNIEQYAIHDILFLQKVATFCIKPISNDEKWGEYCTKQKALPWYRTITSLFWLPKYPNAPPPKESTLVAPLVAPPVIISDNVDEGDGEAEQVSVRSDTNLENNLTALLDGTEPPSPVYAFIRKKPKKLNKPI